MTEWRDAFQDLNQVRSSQLARSAAGGHELGEANLAHEKILWSVLEF